MSADNGYILRQLANRKWIAQYVNMSSDLQDGDALPLGKGETEYSTLEYAVASIKEAVTDTEYGIVGIYYDKASGDEERAFYQIADESLFRLRKKENPIDMDVILKVYDALHQNGLNGSRAINVIKAIDERGVMFVEKK